VAVSVMRAVQAKRLGARIGRLDRGDGGGEAAAARRRADRQAPPDFTFGDPLVTRLATTPRGVAATVRSLQRTRAMEAVVPGVAAQGLAALDGVDPKAARAALAQAIEGIARRWPPEAGPQHEERSAWYYCVTKMRRLVKRWQQRDRGTTRASARAMRMRRVAIEFAV
jgi:hypothetical protein